MCFYLDLYYYYYYYFIIIIIFVAAGAVRLRAAKVVDVVALGKPVQRISSSRIFSTT